MGAGDANPTGHWESQAIMDLNNRVLASGGSAWDDWLEFNQNWYRSPVFPDFVEQGKNVIEAEYGSSPLFVLKDPRNCRLAKFWFAVLEKAAVEPLIALPIRNPLEVASSLEARDGMHRDVGLLLWLRHVLDAEEASRGRARFIGSYKQLLGNWPLLANRLQDDLNIVWPRMSSLSSQEIDHFVDRDAKHHSATDESVLANGTLSSWIRNTYSILSSWIEKGENPDDYESLSEIRRHFNEAGPAFSRLTSAVSIERNKNSEISAKYESQLSQAHTEIGELRDRLEAVNNSENHDHEKENSAQELASNEDTLQKLLVAQNHINNLQKDLEERQKKIDEGNIAIQHKGDEISRLLLIESQQNELNSENQSKIQKLNDDLEYLSRVIAENKNILSDTQNMLRQRDEEIEQTLALLQVEKGRNEELSRSENHLNQQIELVTNKLKISETWVFRLSEDRQIAERKAQAAQIAADLAEKRHSSIAEQISLLKKKHGMEVEILQSKFDDGKSAAEKMSADYQSQIASLSDMLQQKELELREHASAAAIRDSDHHAEIIALSNILRDREEEMGRLKAAEPTRADEQLAEITALSSILHQRETEMKAQRDAAAKDMEQLLSEITELRRQKREFLEYEEGSTQRARADVSDELVHLTKFLSQLESDLASEKRKTESAMTKIAHSAEEIRTLTSILRDRNQEILSKDEEMEWLRKVSGVVTGYPHWWNFVPKHMREKWQRGRLSRKGLFDAEAYMAQNPDVMESGIDPLRHYIIHGLTEGRSQ
tara:strand:+ start:3570 stop:5885 length:2316 start_codon:yes stop_codon:yes gene_type:complete